MTRMVAHASSARQQTQRLTGAALSIAVFGAGFATAAGTAERDEACSSALSCKLVIMYSAQSITREQPTLRRPCFLKGAGCAFIPVDLPHVRERSAERRWGGATAPAGFGLPAHACEARRARCARTLASRRSTTAFAGVSLDGVPPSAPGRVSWDAGFLLPCPSPASSSRSARSGARAESRGRPSARLRASPAGAALAPSSKRP